MFPAHHLSYMVTKHGLQQKQKNYSTNLFLSTQIIEPQPAQDKKSTKGRKPSHFYQGETQSLRKEYILYSLF